MKFDMTTSQREVAKYLKGILEEPNGTEKIADAANWARLQYMGEMNEISDGIMDYLIFSSDPAFALTKNEARELIQQLQDQCQN